MTRPKPMLALQEGLLHLLDRFGAGRSNTSATERTGLTGERAAYFYLRRHGYTVVARRWRCATLRGEVDLIAWDGDTLAFVEVKTRQALTGVSAEFGIGEAKRAALRRMADAYVRQLPWRGHDPTRLRVRFDAVAVYLRKRGLPEFQLQKGYL